LGLAGRTGEEKKKKKKGRKEERKKGRGEGGMKEGKRDRYCRAE